MKLLLFLLSFLFTFTIFSSETIINQSELRCKRDREQGKYKKKCFKKSNKEVFTGKVIKKNKKGVKISEKNYKDGVLFGTSIFWYDNGKKRYERTPKKQTWWYRNGKKERIIEFKDGKWENKITIWDKYGKNKKEINIIDPSELTIDIRGGAKHKGLFTGLAIYWDEDGYLGTVEEYKNDKLHGVSIEYSFEDIKFKEVHYQNGKKHGKLIMWYKNGKKEIEKNYKDGVLFGTSMFWYDNGKKRYERTPKKQTWWYRNGKKERIIEFKDGKWENKITIWDKYGKNKKEINIINPSKLQNKSLFTGIAISWGEDGYLHYVEEYKNGKLHGVSIEYSLEDKFKEVHYQNGKLNGAFKVWNTHTGKLEYSSFYKNDKLEGFSKSWHENGKLKDSGFYKNGKKHGKFIIWDRRSGNKIREENYKNGKRISF